MADEAHLSREEEKGMDCDDDEDEVEDSGSTPDTSDNDDDEADVAKISELECSIKENPYTYDNHIVLIQLCKKAGEFDKLQSAREEMSKVFPLTEDLWLDWIKDEEKFSSGEGDRTRIESLFQRAIKDYLSVPIWLEYAQFSIGGMGEEGGINKVRDVFEQALIAAGIHISKGQQIWEAYREFENAILSGLMPNPGAVPTKKQEEAFDTQHDRIVKLFKRQLSIPLSGMTLTFSEYKDWMADEVEPAVKQVYDKALEKLNKMLPYEDKLEEAEPPRLAEYQSYIKFELANDDPLRIQSIFERAVQENCLIPELWLQYTSYLATKLKTYSLIQPVYKRSIQNCPWCAQLWSNCILGMERGGESLEKVKGTVDTALKAGFSEGTDHLLLWKTYCEFLRRRIKWDSESKEELELFRETIALAVDYLHNSFGYDGDPTGSLKKYWASIEGKYCKNMVKARDLWNTVMTQGHGNEASHWVEFYNLERAHGDQKHSRRVLQRALNSVTDWPESIVERFLNFEREEGTLEEYDQAKEKCDAQMKRINERRAKETEKEERLSEKKKAMKSQKKFVKQQNNPTEHEQKFQKHKGGGGQKSEPFTKPLPTPVLNKDKPAGAQGMQGAPVFKRKHQADNPKVENGGQSTEPLSDKEIMPPPGYKPPGKTVEPPPGFKPPPENVEPPPGYDGSEPPAKKSKQDDDSAGDVDSSSHGHDNDATIFVSNISYKIGETMLNTMFKDIGEIKEIRLIKDFRGRSKGYAYVEFMDKKCVPVALKMDRAPVDGRAIYISRCLDKTQNKPSQFRYANKLERNKLFIKNLPFTCSKEALETIFKEHGTLRDVRLVTYRSGAPKGLAFVEFEDEESAKVAVLKTDGIMIGDHAISVDISNPPERKAPLTKRDEAPVPTLGKGKTESDFRGKARTNLSLMPRALQKPKASTTASAKPPGQSSAKPDDSSNGGGMSNADFRKMLLK